MDYNTLLALTFLVVISIIIIRILIGPIKLLIRLVFSCIVSTIGILAFNIVGNIIGLHIGLNLVTILTVGILGLPGVALILFLQIMFKV